MTIEVRSESDGVVPHVPCLRPERKMLMVKVATMVQKKILHVSPWFQKLALSSRLSKIPDTMAHVGKKYMHGSEKYVLGTWKRE